MILLSSLIIIIIKAHEAAASDTKTYHTYFFINIPIINYIFRFVHISCYQINVIIIVHYLNIHFCFFFLIHFISSNVIHFPKISSLLLHLPIHTVFTRLLLIFFYTTFFFFILQYSKNFFHKKYLTVFIYLFFFFLEH